ncbi:MAG: glutamine-hydrolyzing carbamoyl-phosphate synthase small subunit [Schwartzia sp.]|nr:glutamine-hydrolyzing carbamoyl-phosphate synthase small subunit [Schwartzia sp. (in: firmicutes)]
MKGKLILEDGTSFSGELFGEGKTVGEVVFNTGMTGYQEILTDPSYCRQIVTLTYPLIGNYGVNKEFMQSRKSFVRGLIAGELCEIGSSCMAQGSIREFLQSENIPCLHEVDTRRVTRHIRSKGAMKGVIVPEDTPDGTVRELLSVPTESGAVREATTPEAYTIEGSGLHVAVLDFGIKKNILKALGLRNYKLTVLPATVTAEEVLALSPDAVFLSNGPGDPKDVPEAIETVRTLVGKKPMFGICLGHQIFALAMGADTYKLKFGHRGSNQPVKALSTGRVHITSQNHGYAVDESSLAGLPLVVTHRSVNDGTVEGIRHKELPVFTVQYHPEASPGPEENTCLFDDFDAMIRASREGA